MHDTHRDPCHKKRGREEKQIARIHSEKLFIATHLGILMQADQQKWFHFTSIYKQNQ